VIGRLVKDIEVWAERENMSERQIIAASSNETGCWFMSRLKETAALKHYTSLYM
jgi:hypothetical protein